MLVSSTDFNRRTTDRTFSYFECQSCGLVFMDAIPQDLRPFYAGGYAAIPETLADLRAIAKPELYRMQAVLRHKSRGRLLEIGPWRGVFCINAQDAGFTVSAIEMDEACVSFLRETVRVDAVQSIDPAATMDAMIGHFDVIALWHSLEHLREPWKIIASAAARLAPGGILLIATPNIESFEFTLLRERWRHLDAPRHLHFYPAAALATLCAANGMEAAEIETHDHLSELLALDTWTEWARRRFGEKSHPGRIASIVYKYALWRERKLTHSGSGITAIFQLKETRSLASG